MAWQIIGADSVTGKLPPRVKTWLEQLIADTVGPKPAVLVYSTGVYRMPDGTGRPDAATTPPGWATYMGPVEPTDWLSDDEWVKTA